MKSMEEIIQSLARRRKLFIALLVIAYLAQAIASFTYGISVGRNQVLCYIAVTTGARDKKPCEAVSWLMRQEPPPTKGQGAK